MPKKDDDVKDVKDAKVDQDQEQDQDPDKSYNEEDGNDKYRENDYKNALWISDIHDDFYGILDDYSYSDDRLKWVGMSDILYGRRSNYQIMYDEVIVQFIDEFVEQIESLVKYMKKKKLHIIEDDREEFERLLSLNEDIIYSRIAGCLEKWYV